MSTSTLVELPTLDFVGELAGFPHARHFALVPIDGADHVLFWLKSLDVSDLEFVVAAPYAFFPGYSPEIDDATVERLELNSAEEAAVLVILTVGKELTSTTANLLAPIVVNTRTLRATQAVLIGPAGGLREPLSTLAGI
jgi:flagellar assembly factor FliW